MEEYRACENCGTLFLARMDEIEIISRLCLCCMDMEMSLAEEVYEDVVNW